MTECDNHEHQYAEECAMGDCGPQSEDHYRTVFFGYRGNRFFSKPACGCGFTTETDAVLVAHLREKLNP